MNKDSTYHQIVSGNPDTGPSNIFYGDYFGPSESYNVTFDNVGIYQYYDPNWSHINGQITVEDVETTTETGTIENTSDMTSSIDQVSNETNVANEIKPNVSMIDNIAPISSLLGSIASGENHTNQSSASALSTLSTDPTLDSIIDKVRPFFNLLSGENSLNGTLDSIISASNQTLEENPIPETNLSSIEPKLLSGENIDPVMNSSFSLQNSSTTISLEE